MEKSEATAAWNLLGCLVRIEPPGRCGPFSGLETADPRGHRVHSRGGGGPRLLIVASMDDRLDARLAPKDLGRWFARNRRDLPWRTPEGVPRSAWATLVSEVMSQQTRLEVVVPRFAQWLERYPDPAALADASEEEVLAAWAGLGYYSRARNLRRAAHAIARGGWPRTRDALLHLPGVGAYTAAAVASLCFGEQVPMVAGNVG